MQKYRTMMDKQDLLFWLLCCVFTISSAEVSWPSGSSSGKNISSMVLIGDGQKLIICGLNHLFCLNTTNFQLINDVAIGPIGDIDIDVTLVIYNKTELYSEVYITSCDGLNSYCEIRRLSNISDVVNQLEPPIKADGVQAFMTSYLNPRRNQWETFLFVACPHKEIQNTEMPEPENRCSRPGIIWFKNRAREPATSYRFKPTEDTPILTEKYVDAFIVDKYRLFFSLQFNKSSQMRKSRIAQVCQNYIQGRVANKYTTPFTYADMPIECGNLKEIQAVKKIEFQSEVVFIAVFSDSVNSSVCVYTMRETKQKFVENIKDCYKGERVPESEDYIKFSVTNEDAIPCKEPAKDFDFSKPDEYFLCNNDLLERYQQVIGTRVLSNQPAVTYNMLLTSLAVSIVNSKIIAFLGTTTGDILKAVVYPSNSSNYIKQSSALHVDDSVKKDMYTSSDERHIFVHSERKVFKLPVQSCSGFWNCSGCLGSNDPYCGWCFLEKRCSTRDTCPTNREWISASSGDKCPHVTDISPRIMSDKQIDMLTIKVSNVLKDVSASCFFHSDEVGVDFEYTESANVSSDRLSVGCRPTNILHIENKIKGSLKVKVSILTNGSSTTIEGTFIIYRCETFERCIDCSSQDWNCRWCSYSNQCTTRDNSCGETDGITSVENCPYVTNYRVVKDHDDDVWDLNDTMYFSRGRNYVLNITGTNLLEPKTNQDSLKYRCKLVVSGTQVLWFNRTSFNHGSLRCNLTKGEMSKIMSQEGELDAEVQLMWGDSPVYGDKMSVIVYKCEGLAKPVDNCGHCKSFALYQPHFTCKWCDTACVDSSEICNNTDCGEPIISKVYPLSAHMNATTLLEVTGVNLGSSFDDIVDSVTVAGIGCVCNESGYIPGIKIECNLSPSNKVMSGRVVVTRKDNTSGEFLSPFQFRIPTVTAIKPSLGPMSGGTLVTLYGHQLDTGREMTVLIGGKTCRVNNSKYETNDMNASTRRLCKTTAGNIDDQDIRLDLQVQFDGANVVLDENVTFTYVKDPNITAIFPTKSFKSGGRTLTIEGENLYSIQKPKIYAVVGNTKLNSEDCRRDDDAGVIYCLSPRFTDRNNSQRKRSNNKSQARIGFEMDDVSSVQAENLPSSISLLLYYDDPSIKNLTEDKKYRENLHLSIEGERLNYAADKSDVVIEIGCEKCNVTSMDQYHIYCQPPTEEPKCSHQVKNHKYFVKVNIGFLTRIVGNMTYNDPSVKPLDDPGRKKEYIIAGSIGGILIFSLIIAVIIVVVMMRKRKVMKKQNEGLLYMMDKKEAKFRTQCREEFAALQTAVSDLTSDLRGGNVLFREYDVYASKTLFSSKKSDILTNQLLMSTDQTQQAMDTFKGLLRNRSFLLMLIKTFEKEQSFTIHDKSNVATILMILNHDNMEYITGILTTLLDDLIDKNIASGTPKLLLRRSECVAEKLLTHWLSICLYHYLKERSGSALYILYKAIKIQTEKGPIDYITNCGKYTLSEDKLFTSSDTEINPVTLTLEVTHHDFIDNSEKLISVQVLDCDTVTQAKGKMLEILYKNVPFSKRPPVHSTNLEVIEGDEGTKRLLSDEDDSSTKDGIWKRINTLQHYKIRSGDKVNLFLNIELKESLTSIAAGESPDGFIVGSFRRSKPVVRTISGSNFWHLTKKHQTDDEVQLTSDLFLPRLLYTKGTLLTYIDDLFQTILSVGEEPPIIIKFLFDHLDSAYSRCAIKDPDVLHTWKCNSLLLRFWVNIIKNPEFVFDVHKPLIVDSCLSVVAQTLMDSCSTADLVLGPSSPSNKLLFAKDIPRYKLLVRQYFDDMTMSPAVSDQELNSYLTQKVSQKFFGNFNQMSALMTMYRYAAKYRNQIYKEMNNPDTSTPGSFSTLIPKLESVFLVHE